MQHAINSAHPLQFTDLSSAFQAFIQRVELGETPYLWRLSTNITEAKYQILDSNEVSNQNSETSQGICLAAYCDYDANEPIEDCFACATLALLYENGLWKQQYVRVETDSNPNFHSGSDRAISQFWREFNQNDNETPEPQHVFMLDWDES